MNFQLVFLFTFYALRLPQSVRGRTIHILTSLSYNLKLGSDIVTTGGAFAVAVEQANRKYGSFFNVTVDHLFDAHQTSCDDVAAQGVALVANYYYRQLRSDDTDTCYAIVTSSCSDVSGLATLSRGLDWPLFYNTVSKNDFITPSDSPSTVAVGGSYRGYTTVILDLLAYYKWYHATIITEGDSVVPFYKNAGSLLLCGAKESPLPYSIEQYVMPTSESADIVAALNLARSRSRVFILFSTGRTAVKTLAIADKQFNMGNGEYVFISLHPLQAETYGMPSQFALSNSDKTDKSKVNIYRSLFFLSTHLATADAPQLDAAIAERSWHLYNKTYPNGSEPLDSFTVQASFDLVELLTTVLYQSLTEDHNATPCSGLNFAKKVANRTFNMTTGPLYINSGQARNLDVDLLGFNVATLSLQRIGRFEWQQHGFVWQSNRTLDWPTADGLPPKDVPVCGYSGRGGQCAAKSVFSIISAVTSSVVCTGLLTGFGFLTRWYKTYAGRLAADWWQLLGEYLASRQNSSSRISQLTSRSMPTTPGSWAPDTMARPEMLHSRYSAEMQSIHLSIPSVGI